MKGVSFGGISFSEYENGKKTTNAYCNENKYKIKRFIIFLQWCLQVEILQEILHYGINL